MQDIYIAFALLLFAGLIMASPAKVPKETEHDDTETEDQPETTPEPPANVDSFTGHCPDLCQKQKGASNKYGDCMDNCMCAAYCVIFESLSDWPLSICMPRCRSAKPYKSKNFFRKMEKLLY